MPKEAKEARARKRGEEFFVELCGRSVPAINTADRVRAVTKDRPVERHSVERYLESKFGDSLETVRAAMRDVVKPFRPEQLRENTFGFYEQFCPAIPEGKIGWGPKGKLDIDHIRSLASKR